MPYSPSKSHPKSNRYKALTKEEEYSLIRKHQAGDKKATLELFRSFDGFLKSFSWPYAKTNSILTFDDSLQAAKIGFLKAADKFDFSLDGRMSTYASFWIRAELQEAQKDAAPESWVSRSGNAGPVFKAMKNTKDLSGVALEEAFEKVAKDTGVDIDYIRTIHEKMSLRKSSLNAEIGHEGSTLTLMDMLESPYAHPIETITQASTAHKLHEAIDKLMPREKEILAARFGLQGVEVQTLEVLSNTYKISRERVRQIEVSAMTRLARILKERGFGKEDIPVMTGDLRWNEPQPM